MIKVYRFGPAWELEDPSPFCLKILYYLRLAGVPFESVSSMRNLRESPKGKLPFICDGEVIIGDSGLIVEYLKDTYGDRVGAGYTQEQCAIGRAVARMLEESTYWAMVHSRWRDPENWHKITKPEFFGSLPWPLRILVPAMVQRDLRRSMHGQGMGRHSAEEIMAIGQRDLAAVADCLGNKPYLLGPNPSEFDATVQAFLVCCARAPHPSPLKDYIASRTNLCAYMERMEQRLTESETAEQPRAPVAG